MAHGDDSTCMVMARRDRRLTSRHKSNHGDWLGAVGARSASVSAAQNNAALA